MKNKSLIAFTLIVSCSTTRVRHKGEVYVGESKRADFRMEKSLTSKKDAILCGLTGILYGGWCWAYLNMPNDAQTYEIRHAAEQKLNEKYGEGKYQIRNYTTQKVNYTDGPEIFDLSEIPTIARKKTSSKDKALLPPPASSSSTSDEATFSQLESDGYMRRNCQLNEVFVAPHLWRSLAYNVKENMAGALARDCANKKGPNKPAWVTIKDLYSGKEIASYGVMGFKNEE